MPATCVNCEKVFDASYDFSKEEIITERELLKKNKESLCWECRLKKVRRR
jgi:hypothetical protein